MFKKPLGIKKTLGLLIAASALTLAACGGNETASTADNNEPIVDADGNEVAFGRVGAMDNFTVGTTFQTTSPLQISLLFRELAENPFSSDWFMLQQLYEKTGVDIFSNAQAVLHDDFATQRQLLISTGNAPELMPFIYGQDVPEFVPGGQLLPVSDFFQYMPHFTHLLDEWDLWSDLEHARQPNGNIYWLPGLQEDTRVRFTVAMRQDILDDLGLDVPDNWDEIRDVLREVEAAFPGTTPFVDAWGGDSTLNIAARTFGVRFGWGFGNGLILDHETNTHHHVSQMPEMYDFVSHWASMVEEGLLLDESLTSGFDEAWEMFINGYSFMVGTNGAPMQVSLSRDIQEIYETGIAGGPFGLENAEIVTLPIPNGPTGKVGEARLNNGLVLNRSIQEREDFIAILQFVDWLWYSEEGREFSLWGIEGETFTRDADGRRVLKDGFFNNNFAHGGNTDHANEWTSMAELGFGETVWLPTQGGSRDLILSALDDAGIELHMANTERIPHAPNPGPPFNDEEREIAGSVASLVNDLTNSAVREFMIGRRPMSEWADFAASVAADAARLEEIADTAHRRERLGE